VKVEQTECSEMLAYKIPAPGNYPQESIQQSEQGECLKLIRNYAAEVYVYIDISCPTSETAVCSDCYCYGTEV
jgi:hypothetical protein